MLIPKTIRLGSQGPEVEQWQKIVGATADGVFGAGTESKTRIWQTVHGLDADGIVGPRTWDKALGIQSPAPPSPAPYPFVEAKHYNRGRKGGRIDLIVIHTMEAPEKPTTAESVAAWFASADAPPASAHFCIDQDSIVQCVRESDTAWHAPGANHNGIGIEHAGYARQTPAEWADEASTSMLRLSATLVADLCRRYDIPVERPSVDALKSGARGIVGHIDCTNAFSGGRGHVDPGPNFPFDRFFAMVREELDGPTTEPSTGT
jgi:N-acetyl-anhydromuramyl-L-alanine amidase AmpD